MVAVETISAYYGFCYYVFCLEILFARPLAAEVLFVMFTTLFASCAQTPLS